MGEIQSPFDNLPSGVSMDILNHTLGVNEQLPDGQLQTRYVITGYEFDLSIEIPSDQFNVEYIVDKLKQTVAQIELNWQQIINPDLTGMEPRLSERNNDQ